MLPCYLYKTSETNRSRTVQSEGSRIGWELAVPPFITVELLNVTGSAKIGHVGA